MQRLGDWLRDAEEALIATGIESARMEARVLAGHALGKPMSYVLTRLDDEVSTTSLQDLLERRLKREPLAYILGYREFYGRRFKVNPSVLIPRQETEVLVEAVLRHVPTGPVLDVGTGSGCIAITLQLEQPELDVTGVDSSLEAIQVAAENARILGAKVRWRHDDDFAFFGSIGTAFEAIVSNPPYIADGEKLMPEVGEFEPKQALFAGPTGLEFYERLSMTAATALVPNGKLFLEVGHTQADEVMKLFRREGWRAVETVKDLSYIQRVLVLSKDSMGLP
jgi:release factor glutamine methyltransferase